MSVKLFLKPARGQLGFTLFETLIVLSIVSVMSVVIAQMTFSYLKKEHARYVAQQITHFSDALERYIAKNESILFLTDNQKVALINSSELIQEGFLSPGFIAKTSDQQNIIGLVKKNASGTIEALTITQGGPSLTDDAVFDVVSMIGANGGGIYLNDANHIVGLGNLWTYNVLDWNGENSKAVFSSGHIVKRVSINAHSSLALFRQAIINHPEFNQMQTSLDMTNHAINNVNVLQVNDVVTTSKLKVNDYLLLEKSFVKGDTCEANGALAVNESGEIISCQNHVWQNYASQAGQVAFFTTPTCPDGWVLADGQNQTVDLRGVFIRGLDQQRGLDPNRELASYQSARLPNITGQIKSLTNQATNSNQVISSSSNSSSGYVTGSQSLYETNYNLDASRASSVYQNTQDVAPANVALLACQKRP